jgi:uncharacterized protein (TIGR03435 family)
MGRPAFACAAMLAALALCAGATATAQSDSAKPQMMAKDADPDWDVATVKPSDPTSPGGQRINLRGRQVVFQNTTVEQFLLLGYGLQKSQLAGEPDWVKTERWNVDGLANVDGKPNWKQTQGMMRKLLAERFGLKLHPEQREMPVFALTIAKGGPKLTPNASDPDGLMDQQNTEVNGQHAENLKNTPVPELALILQFHVDRPVVDQTGLKGRYDFQLKWTVDESKAPTDGSAAPGLFTAIQEQIGLKLEPVKAPADMLVIDAVERPSAN